MSNFMVKFINKQEIILAYLGLEHSSFLQEQDGIWKYSSLYF
jgi:hypothetical protein